MATPLGTGGDATRSPATWDALAPWARGSLGSLRRNRALIAGGAIVAGSIAVALLAPLIALYPPDAQGDIALERLAPPSRDHLLGTDRYARDALSRIIHGSRASLLVGLLAAGLSVALGVAWGGVAGFCGGLVDRVLMRAVDVLLAFPAIVLLVTCAGLWRERSVWLIVVFIGLFSWMGIARLVRGQILALKEREHYLAARALGAGPWRLLVRHLLPHTLHAIIIAGTLRVGAAILVEGSLSYLGLGVPPPTPSWGNIIFESRGSVLSEWWIPLAAGLAIVVTVIGFHLLGDGLRRALDPRPRE